MIPGLKHLHGARDAQRIEHVHVQRTLHRLLAFTGRTIDDVVNCPIAKREILGYWKVQRQIDRATAVSELESQWNPLGRRT